MEYSILIVDDEPVVRETTRMGLDRLVDYDNYQLQICEAPGGSEALEIITRHVQKGETIYLVISDVEMRGMNGLQLVTAAKAISPETRYVLMSGRIDHYRLQAEALGATALAKSLTISALAAAVKLLLPPQNQTAQ